jgi:hypothetical protein
MGATSYSDKVYASFAASAATSPAGFFPHDYDVKTGAVAAKVHEKLDPAKPNKAGKIIRESFDSDAHPESLPIVFGFDNTGSMLQVPQTFVKKLDKLMAILVKKGYVPHPAIMMASYNDATTTSYAPLQVGQFEAGNEMDEALSLISLEGGGGGHITESAELLMYFLARHTDLHSVAKRGKKGYLFLAGDELPYPVVDPGEVKRVIGDVLQAGILTSASYPIKGELKRLHGTAIAKASGDILEELREKFEVFWIMPGGTNHENNPAVTDVLQAIFGQNFIRLPNPDDVCELVAATIGLSEGYSLHDIGKDLVAAGADVDATNRATTAIASYAGSRSITKTARVKGDLVAAGTTDAATRL